MGTVGNGLWADERRHSLEIWEWFRKSWKEGMSGNSSGG